MDARPATFRGRLVILSVIIGHSGRVAVAVAMAMAMGVAIGMGMRVRTIRCPLGIEGCLQGADLKTQSAKHFLQHVIRLEAKAGIHDLERYVPIAHVVTSPSEEHGVLSVCLGKRLDGRTDFDDLSLFALQAVPIGQKPRFFQHHGHFASVVQLTSKPTPLTILTVDNKSGRGRFKVMRVLTKDDVIC